MFDALHRFIINSRKPDLTTTCLGDLRSPCKTFTTLESLFACRIVFGHNLGGRLNAKQDKLFFFTTKGKSVAYMGYK